MPYSSWLYITYGVLSNFAKDHTIMVHTLLRLQFVKDPGDIEKSTVMFLFGIL